MKKGKPNKPAGKASQTKAAGKTEMSNPVKVKRRGGARVSIGIHGLTEIMSRITAAGLTDELDSTFSDGDAFITIRRDSLQKLKTFIHTKAALSELRTSTEECDCPDDDPYCIWI